MTTNNSIIFRAEYQEMLDGLRKSVQKALKELNQQYPLVADENRISKAYYLLELYTSED